MAHHGEEEFALFMGGLRRDRRISVLKKNIVQLFNVYLDIVLNSSDVNIIAPPSTRFAFVYLSSQEDQLYALSRLKDQASRDELAFDFSELENPSRGLTVQVKRTKKELIVKQLSAADKAGSYGADLVDANSVRRAQFHQSEVRRLENTNGIQGQQDSSGEENSPEDSLGPSTIVPSRSPRAQLKHAKTSTSNLSRCNKAKRLAENVGTSTTGLIAPELSTHSLPEKCLIIGQYVGNETRNMEFKRGGGQYMKKQLKDHVAKYVCSFLNSGEGGTLLIGVDDNGAVQGVECNSRQENEHRLLIDSVIKGIVPQVFPQQYSVTFVPVLELDSEHFTPIADIHVIEIRVESLDPPERLYETHRGDVYIRRDGSVQGPLRASDIQEWTRMMHRQEDKGRRSELDRLHDEVTQYREREERLEQEQQVLQEEIAALRSVRPTKSKTCVLL